MLALLQLPFLKLDCQTHTASCHEYYYASLTG
jgi:hypothetical protein